MYVFFFCQLLVETSLTQQHKTAVFCQRHQLTNLSPHIADWHILSDDMVLPEFEYKQDFVPVKNDKKKHCVGLLYYSSCSSQAFQCNSPTVGGSTVFQYRLYHIQISKWRDHHIVEFVSGGPKNYSYKLENGQCYCKVEGFTLDHVASQLNFDKMKEEMFLWSETGGSTNTAVSYPNRIRRNPLLQNIFNRDENKNIGWSTQNELWWINMTDSHMVTSASQTDPSYNEWRWAPP